MRSVAMPTRLFGLWNWFAPMARDAFKRAELVILTRFLPEVQGLFGAFFGRLE